jgi:hypothetical protein
LWRGTHARLYANSRMLFRGTQVIARQAQGRTVACRPYW